MHHFGKNSFPVGLEQAGVGVNRGARLEEKDLPSPTITQIENPALNLLCALLRSVSSVPKSLVRWK
jgi:hypothetical protein